MDAQSPNEWQRLDYMTGYQDSCLSNGCQATCHTVTHFPINSLSTRQNNASVSLVNIGSDNGFVPVDTKPSPEPMWTLRIIFSKSLFPWRNELSEPSRKWPTEHYLATKLDFSTITSPKWGLSREIRFTGRFTALFLRPLLTSVLTSLATVFSCPGVMIASRNTSGWGT